MHFTEQKSQGITFSDSCECVVAEGNGDEEGKYLLSGPRWPPHEPGDIEQRVHHQEKAVPEPHRTVHGMEVQLEVVTYVENNCGGGETEGIRDYVELSFKYAQVNAICDSLLPFQISSLTQEYM